jgi:hypothetical protein
MREFVLRAEGQTDGMAWIDLLLQKHGRVMFELQWMVFMLGQAGSLSDVLKNQPERKQEVLDMLDAVEEGCVDLEEAVKGVTSVARDIIANSRRNTEKVCR